MRRKERKKENTWDERTQEQGIQKEPETQRQKVRGNSTKQVGL